MSCVAGILARTIGHLVMSAGIPYDRAIFMGVLLESWGVTWDFDICMLRRPMLWYGIKRTPVEKMRLVVPTLIMILASASSAEPALIGNSDLVLFPPSVPVLAVAVYSLAYIRLLIFEFSFSKRHRAGDCQANT